MNFLPLVFEGPIPESIKRAIAVLLVGLAAVIILPTQKKYYTWKQYGWLFCLCALVALWLLWDYFSGHAKKWMKSMAAAIHRIIYRGPRDWEDDFHHYGI